MALWPFLGLLSCLVTCTASTSDSHLLSDVHSPHPFILLYLLPILGFLRTFPVITDLRILLTRLKPEALTFLSFLQQGTVPAHLPSAGLPHISTGGPEALADLPPQKCVCSSQQLEFIPNGEVPGLFICVGPQFLPTDVSSSFCCSTTVPFGRKGECKTALTEFALHPSFIDRTLVLPST